MKRTLLAAAIVAALAMPSASWGALFSDDFNSVASAANYDLVTFGENEVTWAYDYSQDGIPPAPNTTDGSTLGVKFAANMTEGSVAAATLHTVQQFSGNYIVKFDGWINANGPFPDGGFGSTEFLTAGVGGDGVTVNRPIGTGVGGWTAVDGEGGSGIDYRLYKNADLQGVGTGQYEATDGGTLETGARRWSNEHYAQFGEIDVELLPVQGGMDNQTGTTKPGTFGFAWHEVELHVNSTGGTDGAASVEWYIDGLLIGTLDAGDGAFASDGSVTVGYADPFSSVSDNATWSFGLIDNLRVIPEPSSIALCLLAAIGLLVVRRR